MVTDDARTTLARCYVAIAEVDWDLAEWQRNLARHRGGVAYHVNCWRWIRGTTH